VSAADAIVRLYQPGDELSINDGFNEVFGQGRGVEDWHWKYPAEPVGRFVTVAAEPSGRVVAHFAAVPAVMTMAGQEVLGGQGADAYCRPEAQRSRLYSATARFFHERCCGPGGIGFFYGFAGARNAHVLVSHLDYRVLLEVPLWSRRPHASLRRWGYTVRHGLQPGALDALWTRCADRYRWAVVRDSRWYGRRFAGRPGVPYVHLQAWRRGALHGWLVARLDGGVLRVADILWDGGDPGALAALDAASQRLGRTAGCSRSEMWLLGDPDAAVVLLERGWRPAPPEAPIFVVARSHHPAAALERVGPNLYVTMTDADMV
jgi:hypothetical protein